MVCKITDDESKALVAAGAGYVGVGGQSRGLTGDLIYGMEDSDYFIPKDLLKSNIAIEMFNRLEEDIAFFSSVFKQEL